MHSRLSASKNYTLSLFVITILKNWRYPEKNKNKLQRKEQKYPYNGQRIQTNAQRAYYVGPILPPDTIWWH
jgi:hypothetical protein